MFIYYPRFIFLKTFTKKGVNHMSKSVTMQDVADHAQVSIATVSRILNNPESVREATRKKVIKAMNELGFSQNNPRLPDEQSSTILIVIQTLSNQFDTDLAASIMNTAYIHGYNAMVVVAKGKYNNYESFEALLKDVNIAGIVLETDFIAPELVAELQLHYPVVMCSDYIENMDISYVSINDMAAARTATDYLISTGHTKIALVNCNPSYRYSKHREKGYVNAMVAAGLEIRQDFIIHLSSINYFLALSYIRQLLESKNRPDAIFACCDVFGMAAINAASQLGIRVPEDLSIVGFDNTNTSRMTNPMLTTVAQPTSQIGSQACELLIEKIRTKNFVNQQIILDTELIIRNSTKPRNM